METRTNKLIKIKGRDFSMKLLYTLFIKYLTTDCGWKLIRDKATPYGALIKIPNMKSGEYGYLGVMYDEIQVDSNNYGYHRSDYDKSSYWNWLKQDDVFKDEVVYPYLGDTLKKYGRYDVSDGIVTPYEKKVTTTNDAFPYGFNFGTCMPIKYPVEGKQWVVFHTETLAGTIADGTRISIGHMIYTLSNITVKQYAYADELDESNVLGHAHYQITAKLDRAFTPMNDGLDDLITFPTDSAGNLPFTIGHCEFYCTPAHNSRFLVFRHKATTTQGTIPKGTRVDIDGVTYTSIKQVSSELVKAGATSTVTNLVNALDYDYYEIVLLLERKYQRKNKKQDSTINVPSKLYTTRKTNYDVYNRPTDELKLQLDEAEVFHNSANVIFFSMFKQYSDQFTWNELMQNNKRYYDSFGYAGVRNVGTGISMDTAPQYTFEPPAYPGMGCPALGFSSDYIKNKVDPLDIIHVYFSASEHNASIVLNINDRWEYASVGFFTPMSNDHEYAFPAYVTTSQSGLRPSYYRKKYDTSSAPGTQAFVNMLDFSENNTSLGHAMPTYQAFNVINEKVGNYTGTQAMLPNGKWISFGNYKMERVVSIKDGTANTASPTETDYYKEPVWFNSKNGLLTIPTSSGYTLNLFRKTLSNEFDNQLDQSMQSIIADPVYYNATREIGDNSQEAFLLGKIPQVYRCSSPITRYGVYRNKDDINDLYLIVPNCWEGREWAVDMFTCDYYYNTPNWQDKIAERRKELEKISSATNTCIRIGRNSSVETYSS